MSHNLVSPAMEQNTLVELVRTLASNQGGAKVSVDVVVFPENVPLGLSSQLEVVAYRVIQEALQNAIKHSECTQIEIQITKRDDALNVYVEDNGKGFDMENSRYGIGLMNMRSRVEGLNGDFNLDSNKGRGTIVSSSFPVRNS